MPEGPVIDPQQERIAVTVLLAGLIFGIVGIVATIGGTALALITIAKWVFSQ